MKPILLATGSKYKAGLFERLGVPFEQAKPPYREHAEEAPDPVALASAQARGKAHSLARDWPDHLIIGTDQVLALEETIFTKPGSVAAATEQLCSLSGRTHVLHAAFFILDPRTGLSRSGLVTSRLTLWPDLDPAWIDQMVRRDETLDCVGGYKIESLGILLMEKVETEDLNAVVGLPLISLARALEHWGYFRDRFGQGLR